MIKKTVLILILISSVVFPVLFYHLKIPHKLIGRYLSPSDTLTYADAIIVVSGDSDRLPHAVSLYNQGFAPTLILSGATREGSRSNAKAMETQAIKEGVSQKAIILEEKATNTYENTLYTKDIILSEGFKKLILVTSPYHQRRTYETFKHVLDGHNIILVNSPSISSSWKTDNWWISEKNMRLTKDEIMKIFWIKILGKYY